MADDALSTLIQAYHELNPDIIDEMNEEPSPLEFMRYVAKNRPFVIRGGAKQWKACRLWNAEYLTEVMQGQLVNVAITPFGNADSPHQLQESSPELCFVKPYEREELFPNVLRQVQKLEKMTATEAATEPVRYAQTQNDNLRNEYVDLFKDVPKDIPFTRIALQRNPEAVNFWLGNSHSTTALHKDNYENIYVQVLGHKHFVLLPPICAPCINEQLLPAATYTLGAAKGAAVSADAAADDAAEVAATEAVAEASETAAAAPATPVVGVAVITKADLNVQLDNPVATVPFATWDPDRPDTRNTPWTELARPLRVELREGDMMYLPAMWYHKVSQSCNAEGLCCAVNYWYDMDFTGGFFPMCSFVREIGLVLQDGQSQPST